MGDHIPPSSIGPGKGMGAASTGPGRGLGPGRTARPGSPGKGKGLGKDPSMMPRGYGVFGRTPNVEKDGDPLSRRSPNRKPGNNSFF